MGPVVERPELGEQGLHPVLYRLDPPELLVEKDADRCGLVVAGILHPMSDQRFRLAGAAVSADEDFP